MDDVMSSEAIPPCGPGLISVVIPLYNMKPYIRRAVDSVLGQTYRDFELIVVDDGSTDGGDEVVASLQDPRILLVRQENSGVSVARNRGIAMARGELIAFLDADDAWKPGFLESIIQLRKKFPQAGIYATAFEILKNNGQKREYYLQIIDKYHNGLFYLFEDGPEILNIITSAMAVPKSIFDELGGFVPGEVILQDTEVILKIAIHYPIAWCNDNLAIYYQNTADPTTKRSYRDKFSAKEPAVSITARRYIDSGILEARQEDLLRDFVAGFQLKAAWRCLMQGKKDEALRLMGYVKQSKRFLKEPGWQRRCVFWTFLAKLPVNVFPIYEKIKNGERYVRNKFKGKG